MKKFIIIIAAAVLFVACGGRQNEALKKKSSSGKTLEVLLVANKGQYYGMTRDLIDSIFRQPQDCLPQPEPRFDVVNIPVSSLHNAQMFRMHRNIILCELKADNPDKVYIERDKWASPQVVVGIEAKSEASTSCANTNTVSWRLSMRLSISASSMLSITSGMWS